MIYLVLAVFAFSQVYGEPIIKIPQSKVIKSIDSRVKGGEFSDIQENPWLVAIQCNGGHLCSGSIISELVILTAGHCMIAFCTTDKLRVRAGSSRNDRDGTKYKVAKIVRHENYHLYNKKNISGDDLALLMLTRPIAFTDYVSSVPLFSENEDVEAGTEATVAGWGSLWKGGPSPPYIRSADLNIVDTSRCAKAYSTINVTLTKGQICAAQSDKSACEGDSGGPLIVKGRQVGIVSWANGCAERDWPGVYVAVAHYRSWIDEKMKDLAELRLSDNIWNPETKNQLGNEDRVVFVAD